MSRSKVYFAGDSNAAAKDLQMAIWNGHYLEVLNALKDDADPNANGIGGYPLLIGAIYRGRLRIVQVLLDHGANPITAVENHSALEAAVSSGHSRIAYLILKFGIVPTWRDANMAVLCGRTRLLKTFLKNGIEVNRLEGFAGTATVTLVMTAAFAGEPDAIRVLAEAGADINLSNENGWTALLSAAACGHTKVVEVLLSLRADAKAMDRGGDTPLKVATKEGHEEVIFLLEQAEANQR